MATKSRASRKNPLKYELDAIDRRILQCLVEDGRMSTLEVADRVGLSATPCSRRIRQLEEAGVISGYAAKIGPAAMGLSLCVAVSVKLSHHSPDGHEQFISAIRGRQIAECLLVTGSSAYLLRVWVEDIDALREFITNGL